MDDLGICPVCKEHTDPSDPCCNTPAWSEGGFIDPALYDNEAVDYANQIRDAYPGITAAWAIAYDAFRAGSGLK